MSYNRRSTTQRPTRSREQVQSCRKVYEKTLNVEKNHIGYLIGPKGSVIKKLQQKHGIRSRIDQEKRVYKLSGTERDVIAAVAEIQQHIEWINNVTSKREQSMAREEQREEQREEEGWANAGPRRRTKKQPRRMVEKTTEEFKSENHFAGLDSDSEDETDERDIVGKYNGEVPAVAEVFKPTGCWAQVSAEVKEDGDMKLSRGMLLQRLADAEKELEDAEKRLKFEKDYGDDSSWADSVDIEDAEDEVYYWNGVVDGIKSAIKAC